jgi:hypothetical protein
MRLARLMRLVRVHAMWMRGLCYCDMCWIAHRDLYRHGL